MDEGEMDAGEMHTDGNATAGLLQEIFMADFTMLEHTCFCGDRNPGGAHRCYKGAGIVLRCPTCGAVGLRVAKLPDRYVVELRGAWSMPVRQ